MDEYISREVVINITAETGAWETQNRIRELPAADVQPIKHGRWIKRMSTPDSLKCSVCGNNHEYETTYCPHCGVRMDGDVE